MVFHNHILISANRKHAGTTISIPMTIIQNASQKLKKAFFISSYQSKFPRQVTTAPPSSNDIVHR